MAQKTKNSIVFLISILLAIGVYVWFFPLNKGTLELKTGIENYRAFIEGQELPCHFDPCTTKLQSGLHRLLIQKAKYATMTQDIVIKRGEVNTIEVDLRRVYTLEPTDTVPHTKEKPKRAIPITPINQVLASTWNADESRLIYLDSADERVKIWSPTGTQLVTALTNIKPPLNFLWSTDQTTLVAHQGHNLYFINVAQGARKKQELNFIPRTIQLSPNGQWLVMSDENGSLYQIHTQDQKLTSTQISADLAYGAWIDEGTLLYFTANPETNRTDILTYTPENGRQVTLTVKFDFLATRMAYDAENKTAYLQKNDEKWYELRL
ncbi:MAG: WD40 repeat domain-containing protein [Candidatus Peregrinibacteria bacterium]